MPADPPIYMAQLGPYKNSIPARNTYAMDGVFVVVVVVVVVFWLALSSQVWFVKHL